MTNVVILGGGHNGLAAAFYLAKAGVKPIVVERSAQVGGGAITSEFAPGFHGPALSHDVGLHDQIQADMDLRQHGLELITPDADVCAPSSDGAPLVLWNNYARTVDGLRARGPHDAAAFLKFRDGIDHAVSMLADVLMSSPPDIDSPSAGDVWQLLKTGRQFRGLGKRGALQLLRWVPMPIADFTREWFEDDLLRAVIAAPGVSGTMLGPRSAGSTLVMLLREAHRVLSGQNGQRRLQIKGGPGRLTQAMAAAARAAGAEIRTGARAERIIIRDERVAGVVVSGQEIPATTVLSALDPKTTFLELIDPLDLTPDFLVKMRNYRAQGTVAKVNIALSALPSFTGISDKAAMSGRIHIGPNLDYLERAFDHAKYGEVSAEPWLDISIPSILDSGLAPAGGHVMSVYAHYAPYTLRGADWSSAERPFLTKVLDTLEHYAPGLRSMIVSASMVTPAALHAEHGFSGGHLFHGELSLDQLYAMRPLLGFGRYETSVGGLYLCGAGTHPGGFMSGVSGKLAARRVLQSRGSR
jgi:phytoene dehydrogenase-like protein